ncbi:MAG: carboxypeptidase-like regulatory domain-containing protein, partial [Acidobacteriota bacterium]
MNKRKLEAAAFFTLWTLIIFGLAGHTALAQSGTSSVSGAVADPQGNVVAGATVTLRNSEKNFTRTQVTNESGVYSFTAVPPATYVIEVNAAGFKKLVVSNVQALVAKPTEANVQLEIGNVAETVTVDAGASESLINTQDA